MRATLALGMLAACSPEARYTGKLGDDVDARTPEVAIDAGGDAPAPDAPYVALPTTPGVYRGSCDGSAAVALDADHFAGFSDNDQKIRVYRRGANAAAIQTVDIGAQLNLAGAGGKVDIEDVERIGDRLYALSSHGRKNDGVLDPDRYRFVAIDVGGAAPSFSFAVTGSRTSLLSDLLVAANWTNPDPAVIDALTTASQLGQQTNTNLAPKASGINMEGIARAPVDGIPDRLVIGLRNPRPGGKALVVSLVNADAFAGGATAKLGEAFALDFGGLGIRGMTWAPAIGEVLIIAGPHDDSSGPFRLYRWRGTAGHAPSKVMDLGPSLLPQHMKPEGVVRYPGTADVEIVLDGDDQPVGNTTCDDAPQAQRTFGDVILRVE